MIIFIWQNNLVTITRWQLPMFSLTYYVIELILWNNSIFSIPWPQTLCSLLQQMRKRWRLLLPKLCWKTIKGSKREIQPFKFDQEIMQQTQNSTESWGNSVSYKWKSQSWPSVHGAPLCAVYSWISVIYNLEEDNRKYNAIFWKCI